MATNNALDLSLSGSTGTGNFVGTTSPTLITPILGVASATSLTFSSTTNGLIGTGTSEFTNAGYVGEYITNNGTFSATTNVAASACTLALTAGDWDVWGIGFTSPAATTTTSYLQASLSASNTVQGANYALIGPATAFNAQNIEIPYTRVSIASPTNYFCVITVGFAVSTMTAGGFLYARRRR